jgi:PhoPQ-activated pathogenicity-related protein
MRWNGVQNFMLTNDCGEVKYKADEGIKEWEPEKIVTPATWPAENVLYIAIAAIVLYGAYVVFFRKSEN